MEARMRIGVAGLAALASLGGCMAAEEPHPAGAGASRGGQCFNAAAVSSFRPVSRDMVDVEVSRRQVYRLELGPGCLDVDWANRVALRSRTGSFVCGPADAELIVPSSTGRADRCTILGIRRLNEAEIEAARGR
jgi:hypothetical protein